MTNLKGAWCLVSGHDWGPWWLSSKNKESLEIKRGCRRCHLVERRELPRLPLNIRGDEEILDNLRRGGVG